MKNFFKTIFDSLESKALSRKIKNADTELIKCSEDDMLYCTSEDYEKCLEVIIPDDPISDIESFNLILDILSNFKGNEIFSSYSPVKIKAFSKYKKSIIGYATAYTYNRYTTNAAASLYVYDLSALLEFVIYLTEHNISLRDLELKDLIEDDTEHYYIRFPHKLKVDENLNPTENIKWFLNKVTHVLKMPSFDNIENCEKKFFFSGKLFEIFNSVFMKEERIEFSYLNEVLEETIQNCLYFRGIYYDSEKYPVAPNLLVQKYQNINTSFKDMLYDKNHIIFENQNFLISCINNNEMFLMYKEYTQQTLDSIKALAKILNATESTSSNPFGIKYFIYSLNCEYPIGFAIDEDKVNYCLNNKNSFKDFIINKNENQIIKFVKKVFSKLDDLYDSYNCIFNENLKLEDIIYCNKSDEIYIKEIYNISLDTNNDNFSVSNAFKSLKADFILNIFKEENLYKIDNKVVTFDASSKIWAFSPTVIEGVKKYLLTGNVNIDEFLNGIKNSITNCLFDKNIYYYAGYKLNPYKSKLLFKDEICNNEDSNIFVFKDLGIKIANSKRAYDKILNILVEVENLKKRIITNGISVINQQYELVYERKIIKNHDLYRPYAILCKKVDDSLYKLSDIQKLYSNGTFDNKETLDVIINTLVAIPFDSNLYLDLDFINIDANFKPCVQIPVLLESKLKLPVLLESKLKLTEVLTYDKTRVSCSSVFKPLLKTILSDSYIPLKTLKEIRDSLDTKCSKHNFWYNHEDCCSMCYPDSIGINLKKIGLPLRKVNGFNEYNFKRNGQKYLLRLFDGTPDMLSKNKAKLEELMSLNLSDIKYKFELYPIKKVLNSEDMQVIGYLTYINDSKTTNFKSKQELKSNKDRLQCIYNLISFIEEMNNRGISLNFNNFLDVISFDKELKPVVTDSMCITKSSSKLNEKTSILKFIRFNLLHSNISELNDKKKIDKMLNNIKNGIFSDVIAEFGKILNHLNNHCKKHNHYYRSDEYCTQCWGSNIKWYRLKDVKKCKVFSDMGKEAIIYDLGDGMLGKVYRTNDHNEFENELDIDQKEALIKTLIAKGNLNKTSEAGQNFKIVNMQGIILDNQGLFRGIIIEKILNAKSIKILTDKVQLVKYNITRKDIFKILISIGYAINCCHENGLYIGDISYNNILFNVNTKKVYIIDIDSVNIKANQSTVFTDAFVDPLAINKDGYAKTSFEADWYSYAILSFYILTLLHPFNGVYKDENGKPMPMQKRKVKKISVLGNHGVKIPAIALSWNFMTDTLINAFLDIFERDKRYDITKYIEANYLKLFGKEEVSVVDEKESNGAKENNTVKEISKKNTPKEDNVLNLFSTCIEKSNTQDERIIARGVSVIGKDKICSNSSVVSICENSIKYVYTCSANCIYFVDESNRLCLCKENDTLIENLGFSVKDEFYALAVPYSNNILFVALNHENERYELINYNAGVESSSRVKVLGSFDNMPRFILSINSRHGDNNTKKISESFLKVLTCLTSELNRLNDFVICADLITDNWFIISNSEKEAYVFEPKTSKSTKVNIPFIRLQDANLSNIIFFNNAIYYPCDGKICSLNVFNLKYLEFSSDKVCNTSRIEIVKDGFRVFNTNSIYDIMKK